MNAEFFNVYIKKQKAKIDEIMAVVIMLESKLEISEEGVTRLTGEVERLTSEAKEVGGARLGDLELIEMLKDKLVDEQAKSSASDARYEELVASSRTSVSRKVKNQD